MIKPRPIALAAMAVLLGLLAAPTFAYTIYLKDGSRLVARQKYTVVAGKALIMLQNGTETSIAVDQIDVARTDKGNQDNYGTAVVLEDNGKVTEYNKAAPPEPHKPDLGDLIASRSAKPRDLPDVRRDNSNEAKAPVKSPSGYADFVTVNRSALSQMDLAADIQQIYRGFKVEEISLFRGTSSDRVLVEITTNSEAAIFRALEASARVLLQIEQKYPGKVGALELLMMTAARQRGGQFVMTPDLASELAERKAEITAFYVDNVQF